MERASTESSEHLPNHNRHSQRELRMGGYIKLGAFDGSKFY